MHGLLTRRQVPADVAVPGDGATVAVIACNGELPRGRHVGTRRVERVTCPRCCELIAIMLHEFGRGLAPAGTVPPVALSAAEHLVRWFLVDAKPPGRGSNGTSYPPPVD